MDTLQKIRLTDAFQGLVASEHLFDIDYMNGVLIEAVDMRTILNDISIDVALYVGLQEYDVYEVWNELRIGNRVVDMDAPDNLTTKEWADYFDRHMKDNLLHGGVSNK